MYVSQHSLANSLGELLGVVKIVSLCLRQIDGVFGIGRPSNGVRFCVDLRQEVSPLFFERDSDHTVLCHVIEHAVDQVVHAETVHCVELTEFVVRNSLYHVIKLHEGTRCDAARQTR